MDEFPALGRSNAPFDNSFTNGRAGQWLGYNNVQDHQQPGGTITTLLSRFFISHILHSVVYSEIFFQKTRIFRHMGNYPLTPSMTSVNS